MDIYAVVFAVVASLALVNCIMLIFVVRGLRSDLDAIIRRQDAHFANLLRVDERSRLNHVDLLYADLAKTSDSGRVVRPPKSR
ncbi:MAG: hypothetical protein ACE5E4_13600 [Candidatus Binatia bacterium]